MRCVECGKTQKRTKQMCWEEWQLCGACAPIKHPESYGPRQRNVQGKLLSKAEFLTHE